MPRLPNYHSCLPALLALPIAAVPLTDVLAQQATTLPTVVVSTPPVQGATLDRPSRPAVTTTPPGTTEPTATVSTPTDIAADAATGVPAREVGSHVSVVTRAELVARGARNADDALRGLPGVSVSRQGGVGHLTQVRLRGAEANHTLVLVDGVVANDSGNGEIDFSLIPAEDIERIEVVRGPLSGLYGSNAIGGAINIVTRRGSGPASVSLRTEFGSLGTREVVARLAAGNERGHIAVSGQWRASDGFSVSPVGDEKDATRLGSFAIRAGGTIAPDASIDLHFRQTSRTVGLDGFGGAAIGAVSTAYDDASVQRNALTLAGASLKWALFDRAVSNEIFVGHVGNRQRYFDGTYLSKSENISEADSVGYRGTWRFAQPALAARHALSFEAQHTSERFTPAGDFDDGMKRARDRLSLAGEWRGGLADTLFLTAGLRHDDNNTFRDFTTWRLAASLAPSSWQMRPHASLGTGVKLPTMFEQFGSNVAYFTPNPNLTPEKSFGWDAGVEVKIGGGVALLDVTYFQANLRNEIRTDYSVFPATPINLAGESERKGIEVSFKSRLTSWLSVGASYAYTDARDPAGDVEIRRAPHTGRVDATATFADGKGSVSVGAVYNGAMTDFRFVNVSDGFGGTFPSLAGRTGLAPYWLLTVAASYKLQPNVEIYGRLENAANARYQEVAGYATAGFAAYAGVKVSLDAGGPALKP